MTGVPGEFIVLFDTLVSDCSQVEAILHRQFEAYREVRNKEFFRIAPKLVIQELQKVATAFPLSPSIKDLSLDFTPYLRAKYPEYLDPNILSVRLVQEPGVCYFQVKREGKSVPIISNDEIPLGGLHLPPDPNELHLLANEELLKTLDEYDWIMISNLFPIDKRYEIADEWKRRAR